MIVPANGIATKNVTAELNKSSTSSAIEVGLVADVDQVTDDLDNDPSCSGVCNIDKITCGPQS